MMAVEVTRVKFVGINSFGTAKSDFVPTFKHFIGRGHGRTYITFIFDLKVTVSSSCFR